MSDIVTYDTKEEAENAARDCADADPDIDNFWEAAPGPLWGWVVLCNGWIDGSVPYVDRP